MRKTLLVCVAFAAFTTACDTAEVARRGPRATMTPSPSPSVRTSGPEPPRFVGEILPIDTATRSRMTSSWRPGCPVPVSNLRLLRLTHWGFDARPHTGELIVHLDVALSVREVFSELFAARFPIQRMRLVDEYGADDDRSMAANNTSAFNCRRSIGDPVTWSEHAYGRAIDINPIQNPYVSSTGNVEPPAGANFVTRRSSVTGLVTGNGVVVREFEAIDWIWGGTWERSKDYQHFSRSGR